MFFRLFTSLMWALFLLFINHLSHLKRGIKEVNCGFWETLLDSTSKKRYLFQSKMNSFFALSWLGCATALLLMAPNDMASNQMEIPLIYINSILMENLTFENHAGSRIPWSVFVIALNTSTVLRFKSLGKYASFCAPMELLEIKWKDLEQFYII